ncbi:putative 3-phytase A [Coleophoma cylindrospora]|uniref:3-phytase n=1 Tax=Coleophoma cylindrospora TaxID=1849047 RepID=A0A3D8QTA9_9HELO|nr:putative 3-phytase A [Coleophoma cylindrospora]
MSWLHATSELTHPSFHSASRSAHVLKLAFLTVFVLVFFYFSSILFLDRVLVLGLAASHSQTAIQSGSREPQPGNPHPNPVDQNEGLPSSPTLTAENVPQYFQTTPELWAGPTATGRAPFLAQTNPVSFMPDATYVPNNPLETAAPIMGQNQNESIFHLMGNLSPYFPNAEGFGVAEYPLPEGANISQVQMLSRHGSRYPTTGSNVARLGAKIAAAKQAGTFKASGLYSFLNDWTYALGAEILVPRGRQELFESGILHYYQYAQLYNPNSKIIVRTTTQDRMLKSAEYFMAGFFGLEWTNNATIEVIIESPGFNNSLAGYYGCKNARLGVNRGGENASVEWMSTYLEDATTRFKSHIEGIEWTVFDTYAAQTMCPYETVAYGYSVFCNLFNYSEWESFGYSLDLTFAGSSAFQSPTGRAIGLGYLQETIARMENHTLGYSGSQINTTLDSSTETFPLNQTLYFDFSHDTNIMSILTAFGLTQFSQFLPATNFPGPHNLTVAHLEPFGARLDIEIIKTPSPLDKDRKYKKGKPATYVHFVLNQRTVPLGWSFDECGRDRLDGWCEFDTLLKALKKEVKKAKFDYACDGSYPAEEYGKITDGAPLD